MGFIPSDKWRKVGGVEQYLEEIKLPKETVQVDDKTPTGTVTVTLSGQGIPQYTIHENAAWDKLVVTKPALKAVRRADAVRGVLAARRSGFYRRQAKAAASWEQKSNRSSGFILV